MTEKLYYADSHMGGFSARVLACVAEGGGWLATLDKTAFFPQGGGQAADTGYIGAARVTDVHEKGGEIWHRCGAPLEPGREYACRLDMEQRLRRMQNHSGEHIVSGIVHSMYGFENVGFHMGESCMTIDLSGELTWEELAAVERRANETVRADLPVRTYYPPAEELAALEYRSKLELKENVRIVEIEGVDRCACCAPHVARTGEVGVIKMLELMRHRGGVRVSLTAGMDALDHFRLMQQNVTAVSNMLSCKRGEAAQAVARVQEEQQRLKERVAALSMELVRLRAAGFEYKEGNICLFDRDLDEAALRELVNALSGKCSGIAAAFSGDDGAGYKYIIGSRHIDLRARAGEINAGIQGRGGGSPRMIQGSAWENREMIQNFVETLPV